MQSSNNLKQLRVLVTRPVQQAQNLCELIRANGGNPVLLPTIEIVPAATQLTPQQLAQQDIIIFISPNAVQNALPFISNLPKNLLIAAIGASTAQALTNANIKVDILPKQRFNSEGLLQLPALQNINGKRISIFKGEDGRELLANTLRERGVIVTEVIVYRRLLPSRDSQQVLPIGQIDIIVCTSNTGLQNLVELVGDSSRQWLLNMPLLVISQRMATFAKELGFVKKPVVADNASDEAIITALKLYQRH